MSASEVGNGLVELCKKGDLMGAMGTYYAPDIVSAEAMGEPKEVRGIDAIHAKNEWWQNTYTIDSAEISGPYVNGDQFSVGYKFETTNKQTGEKKTMDEIAVYAVKNDKIVEERFFYGG